MSLWEGETQLRHWHSHMYSYTHTRPVSRHHIKKTATPILGLLSVLSVALQLRSNRLTNLKKRIFKCSIFNYFWRQPHCPLLNVKIINNYFYNKYNSYVQVYALSHTIYIYICMYNIHIVIPTMCAWPDIKIGNFRLFALQWLKRKQHDDD